METQELQGLFSQYSDQQIISAKQNELAGANDVYVLNCDGAEPNQFVLRVLRQQTVEDAMVEYSIQQRLGEAGILTPVYLPMKDGNIVGHLNNSAFVIAAFMSGHKPEKIDLPLVDSFGECLARIHDAIGHEGLGNRARPWLTPENARKEIAKCEEPLKHQLQILSESYDELDESLPKRVIHGDLWPSNVFAEDDEITTIFDFENAEYTYRILDIARTLLEIYIETDIDAATIKSRLFDGYNRQAVTPLTPLEIDSFNTALKYVTAACASWNDNNGYHDAAKGYLKAVKELEP